MAATDIVSQDEVRTLKRIQSNVDDAIIDLLITQASEFVQGYLSDPVLTSTVTESFVGTGHSARFLKRLNPTAVTSVTVAGQVIPARTSPTGMGWFLDGSVVRLAGYLFTHDAACVIVYTAGWALGSVPASIRRPTLKLILHWYAELDRIGQSSKSVGGQNISFDGSDVPSDVTKALDQVERVVPV